ncbi:MAG: hypothetical protein QOH79_2819 [Acidimicrobiaceae bacterium]
MVMAAARSPFRHAVTNTVAASCGDLAGDSGTVDAVVGAVVLVVVLGGSLERSTLSDESRLQPMNATAHNTTAARRITEST